jgi:hypothetical protein
MEGATWVAQTGDASLRDLGEEGGELRVGVPVAVGERSIARHEGGPALGGQLEDGLEEADDRGLRGSEHDAVLRGAAGRCDDLCELQAAQPAVDVEVAGERAGDRDRAVPHVEHLPGALEAHRDRDQDRRGRRGAPARGVDEEVEQHLLAGRGAGEQEAAAAEARQARLGDGGREPGGDHRVVGVPAGAQHLDRGVDGDGMATGDDPRVPVRTCPSTSILRRTVMALRRSLPRRASGR